MAPGVVIKGVKADACVQKTTGVFMKHPVTDGGVIVTASIIVECLKAQGRVVDTFCTAEERILT